MTRYDQLFLYTAGTALLFCAVLLAVNSLFFHFAALPFPGIILKNKLLLLCLPAYVTGFLFYRKFPQFAFFLKAIGMIYIISLLMLCADTAVMTTPFSLKDQFFNAADNFFGFNLPAFLNQVARHPSLKHFLEIIYLLLFPALKIFPLILAAMREEKQVYKFTINFIITCLIGFTIYYFWPTSAPADVIHNSQLTRLQHHLATQFDRIHAHESIHLFQAGLIAFPSYHTIWAILLAYMFWPRKYLFYPVAVFSSLVIVATLASGWHFLTDIIGGMIVAMLSIIITNFLMSIHEKIQEFYISTGSSRS
ncbi:phosphatase PAP2 family protein [Candidiatus Paracoxiella cheracis]|uniref:phosphatase PAP2 family protein n=1 Tax=Candidiatus Paracoxiella cheracis TaxID=3405120 RepID=UPI003BF4F509